MEDRERPLYKAEDKKDSLTDGMILFPFVQAVFILRELPRILLWHTYPASEARKYPA